jgi:WD40-like Beta Propeller Repeat
MTSARQNGVLNRRSLCGSSVSAVALLLIGCGGSSGGGVSSTPNNGSASPVNGGLTGTMYYSFATKTFKVDLASGNATEIKYHPDGTPTGRANSIDIPNGYFDLSADSKTIFYMYASASLNGDKLIATDIESTTTQTVFNIGRAIDWGEIRRSPDGKKFAMVNEGINSVNGVYIFDDVGNRIAYYKTNAGVRNAISWTSGNRLMYTNEGLYLTNLGDLQNSLRINTISTSSMSINPAGDKIVYAFDKHIWTMSINGDNLQQVTTGDSAEFQPRWSPDGKYISFQSRVEATVSGSSASNNFIYFLGAIPADGKQYTLNKTSPGGSTVCSFGCSSVTTSGVVGGAGVIALKDNSSTSALINIVVDDMMWR